MCGFRCRVQHKGLPSHQPLRVRSAAPEPKRVTRTISAAEININLNLLASRPDSLPLILYSEQEMIFRKYTFVKQINYLLFRAKICLKRFFVGLARWHVLTHLVALYWGNRSLAFYFGTIPASA